MNILRQCKAFHSTPFDTFRRLCAAISQCAHRFQLRSAQTHIQTDSAQRTAPGADSIFRRARRNRADHSVEKPCVTCTNISNTMYSWRFLWFRYFWSWQNMVVAKGCLAKQTSFSRHKLATASICQIIMSFGKPHHKDRNPIGNLRNLRQQQHVLTVTTPKTARTPFKIF